MAGSASDYLENRILDNVLGAVALTAPSPIYLGLWTAALTDASTGATAGEVTGGSYARLAITNNLTNFPAAVAGAKLSGAAFTFVPATANWGTITHCALLDVATPGAGQIYYWADLTTARAVLTGDTFQFPAGSLSFSQS